jgi:cystathionine gamma-synthase
VVDDTVSSFCNIDVLSVADVIITSLSKSFSGYADLLAGSTVLTPNQAAAYAILRPLYIETHHNEMFAGDANKLLINSDDYLERSAILNHNAAAMTAYFASLVADPKVPVTKVCYPPYVAVGSTAPVANLEPFRRRPTPDFPEPGHGCLFSVELADERATVAFYDNLAFHQGPHLGAHRTLALVYNAMIYGGDDAPYHAAYGLSPNQVRFSAGLEDEQELIDTCKRAVAAMLEATA